MKYNLVKFKALFAISSLLIMVTSCVKEREGFTDLSQTSDMVILNGAGTGNFKASNILVNTSSPDTVKKTVMAVFASNNSKNGPVTVTIKVDNAALTAYNAANGTNFQAFPANAFKLVSNTITINGGLEHTGSTMLWIFQNKLDPTVSYMLPISISDAQGKALSNNQNTIYYNVIGNPIAGDYFEDWTRWNAADTTGAPTFQFLDEPNLFVAESPTQVLIESVNNGAQFHLSFTNTNGVLSNFKITLDPASWSNFGATAITTAPILQIADPINGHYRWYFQYLVGANPRSLIQEFRK